MATFLRICLPLALCGCIFGCDSVEKQEQGLNDTGIAHRVISAHPLNIKIDTCAPPRLFFSTPKTHGSTVATPNQVIKGDFFTVMKTYGLEEGLPFSAVKCSYKDRKGNLWFGTQGGGISCFDGKKFTNYSANGGQLSSNNIMCISEDTAGNLWFGTGDKGAMCYNGRYFQVFDTRNGLPANNVWSICPDKKGNVWVGTSHGLAFYDGQKFKTYSTINGLAGNFIFSLMQDSKENLWIATNQGLNIYNGKTFDLPCAALQDTKRVIFSMLEDREGRIWLGGYMGKVCCLSGNKLSEYKIAEGISGWEGTVWCIAEGDSGSIWFATDGGGAVNYDPADSIANHSSKSALLHRSFTAYTTAQGLSGNHVLTICKDGNGALWFGTGGEGLSRFDGKDFILFGTGQGLPDNVITGICEDSGGYWISTQRGGFCYFDGSTFRSYFAWGRSKCVNAVFKDASDNIWLGTGDGCGSGYFSREGKKDLPAMNAAEYSLTMPSFGLLNGIGSNWGNAFCEDNRGNIWIATGGGGATLYDGIRIDRIEKEGVRFASDTAGLVKADGQFVKTFKTFTTKQGLAGNNVVQICMDTKGNAWFATDGGISMFNGKSFSTFTDENGLPEFTVNSIFCDHGGNVWIGCAGGGLLRYDGSSFYTYTSKDGLPDNSITSIAEDSNRIIWIGTNFGISGLYGYCGNSQTTEDKPKIAADNNLSDREISLLKPIFKNFGIRNGFPIRDVSTLFVDSKNKLWVGTGENLVYVDLTKSNRNRYTSPVFIQKIKLDGEGIAWNDLKGQEPDYGDSMARQNEEVGVFGSALTPAQRMAIRNRFQGITFSGISKFYAIPENLVIPYAHHNVTFEFAAINPAKPGLERYQYMLQGYDKDWSQITDYTSANFGNIPEGTYIFKLRAASPEGIWSQPVNYLFTVLPPWYRTWWAYSAYGLTAFLLIYAIFLWRTSALRKDKEFLEQTVKERTAEVVSQKNDIEKQKSLVEVKNKEIIDSINYAQRLQNAILPPLSTIKKYLPDSFLYYAPKDIVAGDFYWMESISSGSPKRRNGDESKADRTSEILLAAACDCTGHGVPGALVSVVCSNALNRAVNEFMIKEPGAILDKVRELVIQTFEKSENEIKDGMDVSLVSLERTIDGTVVKWAGANNPLWLIDDGVFRELPADKQPIGNSEKPKPFTTHTIHIPASHKASRALYLFTDGYADQFGGPKEKKFKYRPFKDLLLANSHKEMEEQGWILQKTLHSWKGNLEQVDDILVFGLKI